MAATATTVLFVPCVNVACNYHTQSGYKVFYIHIMTTYYIYIYTYIYIFDMIGIYDLAWESEVVAQQVHLNDL